MPAQPLPSTVESMTELWATLHRRVPLTLAQSELHYLTSTALAVDDDSVSNLLLRKLRLARTVNDVDFPTDVVRMSSYVEFVDDGETRFCQLVHSTAAGATSYGLSVASLVGAGLIGLAAGQTVLWPGADGRLRDLEVVGVETCPGLDRWLRSDRADESAGPRLRLE